MFIPVMMKKTLKALLFWIIIPIALLALLFLLRAGFPATCVYAFYLLLLSARIMAHLWLRPLQCSRSISENVIRIGEMVKVVVRITNPNPWPILWLYAQETLPEKMKTDGVTRRLLYMPPRHTFHLYYGIKMTRRGCHTLGPLVFESGDIFGLFRKTRVDKIRDFVTVTPNYELLEDFQPGQRRLLGNYTARRSIFNDPTRISGIREYRRGDPLKSVHWKSSAHTGVLHSKDAMWSEKLKAGHPGRIILRFSLVAIPAFGAGVYIFGMDQAGAILRTGIYLFIYLFCAFSLLFLSSLSRLATYFEKRQAPLPEGVGMPWLALGFTCVTIVCFAAFLLPQPPTFSTLYIRDQIAATYKGCESEHGVTEFIKSSESGSGSDTGKLKSTKLDSAKAREILDKRYEKIDKLNDPDLSRIYRDQSIESKYRSVLQLSAATNEAFSAFFQGFIKVLMVIGGFCGLVVLYIILSSIWSNLSASYRNFRRKRFQKKHGALLKKKKRRKAKAGKSPQLDHFRKFVDPFQAAHRDADELVRYIWEALLAYCSDFGNPCPLALTPFEFIESQPRALEDFEEEARYIATQFTFSEYSGQKTPPEEIPQLKKFWQNLQNHGAFL